MTHRFAPGQEVGGFRIEQILGQSEGGAAHLARDPRSEREVVLKTISLLPGDEDSYPRLRHYVRLASEAQHKNLAKIYGLGREGDAIFVVMEYLQGQTLAEYLRQRRERRELFSPRSAYNTIAHLCQGLQTLHERTCHGALTPQNIYVTRNGRFKIVNLAYARYTAEILHKRGVGPYHDSPFSAPEVLDNPLASSSSADVYAVAMLAVELLSPHPIESSPQSSAREMALRIAAGYGDPMVKLLHSALDPDPDQRPETIVELRELLKNVAEAAPDAEQAAAYRLVEPPEVAEESQVYDLRHIQSQLQKNLEAPDPSAEIFLGSLAAPGAAELPEPEPSPDPLASPDAPSMVPAEDPFAKAAKALGRTAAVPTFTGSFPVTQVNEKRYLVSRDGLDYGPYDRDEVLAQLHKDEIQEFTSILDRTTQLRRPLGEMSEFYEAVRIYVPTREARRRRDAETRAQRVETVKKAGKWTGVVGVLAALAMGAMVAGWWFFIRPKPAPLPTANLLASLGDQYKMAPPPRDFAQIALGDDLLKELFAVEEPADPTKPRVGGGKRKNGVGGAGGLGPAGDDENISELDLGAEGSTHVLTDGEIQQTIRRYTGALGGCMRNELKVNPSFKGVSIQFFIKPSGTTGGVKINGSASPGAVSCLTSGVRTMRFPAHGGLNKGVNLPFYLK